MVWLVAVFLSFFQSGGASALLLTPDAPEIHLRAPNEFKVRLETTKGSFVLEVHREWSPHGVDHFYNLVRNGYYDQTRFYRVVSDRWTQFGINGDPKIATIWRNRTIPDDPRMISNTIGTVAYAFAVPNGRTTQIFVNTGDNSATLDKEPFVPFARVISGMDVVTDLYAGYGENSGGGIRAGRQDPIFLEGNAYLDREFPKLDRLIRAVIF
jgi:peptidyl-prolyl cis-trans isomerase A (cyclophilin A)